MTQNDGGGGGGGYKLMTGDLIRLIETQHEEQVAQLDKLGGITGVAAAIGVDIRQGLDSNNAADLKRREETFGSNYIPPPQPKGLLELMWEAFQDLTIIVLTFSGILSVILAVTVGDHPDTGWIEGACIIFAVFVVTFVTAINDYQKEQQFRSLNAVKEDEKIKVIRNGVPAEISKFSLRVGDVVRVDLGDIVPADGVVFDEKELKLDESAMTGESDLMVKNAEHPFLLSGTKVMEGLGKMLVVCVGESSQAGIIKKLILGKGGKKAGEKKDDKAAAADAPTKPAHNDAPAAANGTVEQKEEYDDGETQSPLEAKLYRLTVLIGKLGTTVAILVFLIMCIRFSVHKFVEQKLEWKSKYVSDYLQFFIVAITVLVVAIPEGLPLAVTIALAYSVKKMLLDNNLVRHLDACETMGSATTICSDKTGTLTTNRMTVMQVWIGGQEFTAATQAADEMSETTKDVFCNGICVNSTAEILPPKSAGGQPEHTGNKTECALLQFVRDCGVDYPTARATIEVGHMLTFSSKKKRMSVVIKRSATTCRIYTKGATEVVLGLCNKMKRLDGSIASLDSTQKDIIGSSIIEKYASQGYRTLCLSYRDIECSADEISKWSDDDVETDLTCIGIVGIEDPVRKEVPDSIRLCHRAGIVVRMVTGDNITTARSIAGKCGILQPGDNAIVIEGQEFRSRVLDGKGNIIQAEFDRIWPHLRVMARSSPKDKYTLVTGLMQSNVMPYGPQVVAVTGDGTNDAPALKKANVGFAMGISGTAVAKDASDIILMDDNFTSIVSAIKWGRNVYDSIAKFLQFQLTVNVVAIVLAFLGAVILEQSPLSAVQMLWVNLIMDSFASLALATEPPTAALLERRPYPKTKPLLSRMMTKHILGQSAYQLIVLFVLTFVGDKMMDVPSGRFADLKDDEKHDPTLHMTVVFNSFVWMQLFNEINCRKIHDELNVFEGLSGNPVYIYVTIFQIVMQIIIVQTTGRFFNCKPLNASQWGVSILLGAGSLPVGLALRFLSAKRLPAWMAFCHDADAVDVNSQSRVASAFQKGAAAKATTELGEWEPLDAALYKLSACAPQSWNVARKGAASIALRFGSVDISPNDQLIVSAEDGSSPQQVGSAALTTLPISGSTVKLEFRPSTNGCKATGKAPSFALEALGFEWPQDKIIDKESVCGKKTFKDAVCFKTQYPDEYDASRAVMRTVFTSGNSSFLCTAWLFGDKGHIASNHHCFSSQKIVDTARFEFLYQASGCNQTCPSGGCPIAETLVAKGNVKFIKADPKLDYSILQITNNSKHYVSKYGYLKLRVGSPRLGERIYIPQHPGGSPKKIAITDDDNDSKAATITRLNQKVRAAGNITISGLVGYQADTEGGSSGSPVILRGSNIVIALHHHGGCPNTGTPSSLLYQPFRAISGDNDGFANGGGDDKGGNGKDDSDSDDDSDGDEE